MAINNDEEQVLALASTLNYLSESLEANAGIHQGLAHANDQFLYLIFARQDPQVNEFRERLQSSSRDFLEVSDRLAADLRDSSRYLSDLYSRLINASASFTMAETLVTAATIGPFITAFCTELGKRLGGSVADWAARMKLRPRGNDPDQSDLLVEFDGAVILIELNKDLPDEARLALLDLDVEASAVRGHRLAWDRTAQRWVSADLED